MMAAPAINALHDQATADAHRLAAGVIGYCPVCRRPHSDTPTGPLEAMRAVARHLNEAHDGVFIAQLRIALTAADPFYPAGDDW